ncbi:MULTISPECIES: threonine/serine dehydratase [Fusobacterium]|uniref:threonine ammonia-lyase n=1 Tax=Fusobacterium TaxID=848 RepID=UPI001476B79E|nr:MULTISPECIES: threonine/serine dehydratase [Fusobacterium]NME35074.1 pyridoxal-phosphate dependent enzyme [Fusobacterium sp. FSA-380-WT-3A]
MVNLEEIKKAKERIEKYTIKTPVIRMENLDEIVGCKVYIKAECMQKTNSFKIRGALNKMLTMSEEELKCGVVAASSGNHGKGVAFVAQLLGIKATIVVPDNAPSIKVNGIKSYGAEVVQCPYDERHNVANKLSKEQGYSIVHPYDDYNIIAGQGTIGLEILEQLPDVDYVVVPIGGGGLIGGIATAIKESNPNVKVIGIEPECMCRYTKSFAKGEPVLLPSTHSIADAILTLTPGKKNYPIVKKYVDNIVTVEEDKIAQGTIQLLTKGKVLAEFSSAIGIAAGLLGKLPVNKDSKVCFVISGGNIDIDTVLNQM